MSIKVKPLVWVRVPESRELGMEPYDHAEGFGGSYIVEHRAAGHFDMWKPNLSCGDRFALESAAKAAAQAHHEAAVRAQIEAVEEVDPAAIRAEAWETLIADAIAEAEKAMLKFPQPNYVISKFAEEAGEVVKAAIHCAEGRETGENLRSEMRQAIAMLYRLWTEGDQVHGLPPVLSLINKEKAHGR